MRVLIGNKADLENRQISKDQGVQLQQRYKMDRYVDVSAKENINVEKTLEAIMYEMHKKGFK